MAGLVETFASTLDWKIRRNNVIVEGTSDVALMWLTNALYFERHGVVILGDEIGVVPAGKARDGGVDGLNRRLHVMRQLADADRGPDGGLRFRFIGLYDNDRAGRRAVHALCDFDRRLLKYGDLFLLHPVMPLANGADPPALERRFDTANVNFKGIDWEVEDCISEQLLEKFDQTHPGAVEEVHELNGRKHWEFTRDGKRTLHEFLKSNAKLDDVMDVVRLIRSLRDYLAMRSDHIYC